MEKTNLENLNKLAKLFGTDRLISPEEIQEIRSVLVGVLANNKKELESLTAETRELVNKVLNKVLDEHDTYLEKSKQIAQEAKSDTTEAIQATMKSLEEVKKLCKEVMECKPENGKDADEEYVIGEVLNRIKLPEYKEVVLDDGGAIVDKINSLPVNEENQIDAKHIKNLPEVKGGRVISGGVTRKIVEQMIEAAGGGGSQNLQQVLDTGNTATESGSGNTMELDHSGSGDTLVLNHSGSGDALQVNGKAVVTGNLTVDTNTLFVDATNNVVGIGTTSPLTQTGNKLQVGDNSAANQYLVFQTNNSFERGIQYYLGDGTTLRGFLKWDANEDLLYKGDEHWWSTGVVANHMVLNDTGLGLRTSAPTHTLTLASTSTGIALYNTADQTTNYERMEGLWSSNEFLLRMAKGGTGTQRNVKLVSHGTLTIAGSASSSGDFIFIGSTSGANAVNIVAGSTYTATSGVNTEVSIKPVINQSSTAGYTALLVNPTETTTGSGSKLLADFQVGGTSRFSISNGGETNIGRQVTGNYIPLTLTNSSTAVGDNVVISMRPANLSTGRAQIHAVAPGSSDAELAFYTSNNNASPTEKVRIDDIGNVGIGQTAPTAYLHIKGGAAAAESAPLKLTSGTNLTTPENGAVEYDGTNFYATPSGAVRQTVDLFYNNALTATSNAATVPVAYKMTTVTNNSAATLTITITTSGAVDGQLLMVRIKDFSAVAQTITWVNTENSTVTAPTTSNGSTTLPLTVGFQYNSATSKWRCVASC